VTENGRPISSLKGLPAIVFVAGVLMLGYGVFGVLTSGRVLESILWVSGGLLLRVASGAYGPAGLAAGRLTNQFHAMAEGMRKIRLRVRSWDDHE
jgi:hypothetical protein